MDSAALAAGRPGEAAGPGEAGGIAEALTPCAPHRGKHGKVCAALAAAFLLRCRLIGVSLATDRGSVVATIHASMLSCVARQPDWGNVPLVTAYHVSSPFTAKLESAGQCIVLGAVALLVDVKTPAGKPETSAGVYLLSYTGGTADEEKVSGGVVLVEVLSSGAFTTCRTVLGTPRYPLPAPRTSTAASRTGTARGRASPSRTASRTRTPPGARSS